MIDTERGHETFSTLAAALKTIPVCVIVRPETGTNVAHDWWSLELRELGLVVCDYGLAPTERALLHAVAAEIHSRVETGQMAPGESALIVRLYLAFRTGVLTDLLRDAQRVEA